MQLRWTITAALACASTLAPLAYADKAPMTAVEEHDEIVPVAQVPDNVMKAFKAKYPAATVTTAEIEYRAEGKIYELAFKDDAGKPMEVKLAPDGKVTQVAHILEAKDLPAPVHKAVDGAYPKAAVGEVEDAMQGDKHVYKVSLVTADKQKLKVTLDPSGKILKTKTKKDAD